MRGFFQQCYLRVSFQKHCHGPGLSSLLQEVAAAFTGVCNLCNGAVNFMLDHDTEGRFRMAALQSNAGRTLLESCGRRPDDISSIVLVEPDGHYIKSCARCNSCGTEHQQTTSSSDRTESFSTACDMLQGGCAAHR